MPRLARSIVLPGVLHGALLGLLAGCTFDPEPLAQSSVLGDLMPSSGALRQHLDGASAGLVVPVGRVVAIDTDTGEITLFEEPFSAAPLDVGTGLRARPAVRPADERLRDEGEGVQSGIGFYRVSDRVAVLAVSALTIGADAALYPVGSRAIVLLSAGDVAIEGILDVSAPCDGVTRWCAGPGGGDGAETQSGVAEGCAPGSNGDGSLATVGRTGGGGGGFATDGAPGGSTANPGGRPGGAGGSLAEGDCPGPSLVPLTGGSGGGAGAALDLGGSGGGGGGAVQITSLTRIVIEPPASDFYLGVFAGGAGGGGATDGGGGGGGAGGAILLEAPAIAIRGAYVVANGGGGGGGGQAGTTSNDGEDGQANADVAEGGSGQFRGGTGGTGDALPALGVGGGNSTGGGGGSAGIIRIHAPARALEIDGSTLSPSPIQAEPAWRTAADPP